MENENIVATLTDLQLTEQLLDADFLDPFKMIKTETYIGEINYPEATDAELRQSVEHVEERECRPKNMRHAVPIWCTPAETEAEQKDRLERRLLTAKSRAAESEAKQEDRLERKRLAEARSRAAETEAERKDRLERKRLAEARSRAAETEAEREDRLERQRLATVRSRAAENEAERKLRLERKRLAEARSRAAESEAERKDRLNKKRLAAVRSRAAESEAERKDRLERKRLGDARSRAAESETKRKERLEKKRLAEARSRAAESKEAREDRLERQRLAAARCRASESKEEREARLENQRLATARARAAESKEEREARLEQMQLAATIYRFSKTYEGTFGTRPSIRQVCEFSAGKTNEEQDKTSPDTDIPKIGTHDGTFHCAEVFACYFLKQLPEYENATIVRTRDPELLKTCDIVVDVGAEYDPGQHRYDHHQRTFDGTMKSLSPVPKPWVTKLSGAGLVYLHFGRLVLARLLGAEKDDEIVEKLYDKIYENFVEEIDAMDNCISACPEKPNYSIATDISARVRRLNPYRNDIIGPCCNTADRFHKAMVLVGEEFKERVDFYAKAWWPARELVKASVSRRSEVDEGGEIMELSAPAGRGYPWKDHLFTLEEEAKLVPTIKFVIFLDRVGNWLVQAVPISSDSFESRIPLLYAWRGLRDEELSLKSGIPGGIFVHVSGFIGGNKTREGALKMARATLANHEEVVATMKRLWQDELLHS